MEKIQVLDKHFVPFITQEQLEQRISELAFQLNERLKDKKPLFLAILNGSFMFAADLFKKIEIDAEITFVKLASYQGTSSTGNVVTAIGLDKNLNGRHIVLLEDIIDSGKTLHEFLPHLQSQNPASLTVVTLLTKPEALRYPVQMDMIGFEIDNKFVVGYGLDYDGFGRNIPGIFQLADE